MTTNPAPDSIPSFAKLAADPEIAPLLDFAPVPRKMNKTDGWTAGMQRRFIAFLAWYGSPTKAADELGKARSGIDKVYKAPGADAFRASWDAAVALAEKRRIEAMTKRSSGNGALRAPTLSRRLPAPPEPDNDDDEEDDDAVQCRLDLVHNLALKFLRKVAAERDARLSGEIVAADFYLRQVTFLEVLFDILASKGGDGAMTMLMELRHAGHHPNLLVSTPFSDALDEQRRSWWAEEGQPERPLYPDPDRVIRRRSSHGDYALAVEDTALGATTTPARGYSQEEWASIGNEAQRAAREKQQAEDAEAQRQWEAHAIAEHSERTRSDK